MQEQPQVWVYVALGSNLGQRELHIRSAFDDVAALPGVSSLRSSSLYETEPMGPQDQPNYLNAVCGFEYSAPARVLLEQLQAIERQHGRQADEQRWGARPLDLDILLYGDQRIDEPDLTIPHTGLPQRSFVLWPLMDLAPALKVPGMGTIQDLKERCQQFGIKRYSDR